MALRILSRGDWRARPYNADKRVPTVEFAHSCRGWAVHYNGPPMHTEGLATEMRKLRAVQDYHMDAKGWSDIAYSFAIGQTGTLYTARGWDWDQFANGDDEVAPFDEGGNRYWRSVLWLGGMGEEPSSEVIRNLTEFVHYSRVVRGVGLEVRPHLDWQPKPCPGARLTQLARTLHNWPIPIDVPEVDEHTDTISEPQPEPEPEPTPPSEQDDDMQTLIRADDGSPELYLSDGRTKRWVEDGSFVEQLCYNGMARYHHQDSAGYYQPFVLPRALVDWLHTEV